MGVKYERKPSQIITLNIVPPAFFEVTKCFKLLLQLQVSSHYFLLDIKLA